MSSVANLQSQLDELKANYDESLDTIWMILAGLLVFFMHAGFPRAAGLTLIYMDLWILWIYIALY
jgi:hypothetical protein